jgi:antitoxin PrlF
MISSPVDLDADHQDAVLHQNRSNGAIMESAITVKGQATIPKAIREHLHLKPGDRVKFFVHHDGSVVLLPKLPASALRGIVKSKRRRPVTIDEMTEAAAEGSVSTAPRARLR